MAVVSSSLSFRTDPDVGQPHNLSGLGVDWILPHRTGPDCRSPDDGRERPLGLLKAWMWDGDVTSLPEVGVVFPPLIHHFFFPFFPILVSFGYPCILSCLVCCLSSCLDIPPYTTHTPCVFVSFVGLFFGFRDLATFLVPVLPTSLLPFFCCLELRLEYRSGGDGGGCDDSDGTMGMVIMMGSVFNMAWAWLVVRRGQ